MSLIPDQFEYTKEHEWVLPVADQVIRFGITDYAQSALGDIVYIQLPQVGEVVTAGRVCGEVESTKSVSEIFAPVSGTVVRTNEALIQQPESINRSPYEEGWLAEIEVTAPGDLISAADYRTLVGP